MLASLLALKVQQAGRYMQFRWEVVDTVMARTGSWLLYVLADPERPTHNRDGRHCLAPSPRRVRGPGGPPEAVLVVDLGVIIFGLTHHLELGPSGQEKRSMII